MLADSAAIAELAWAEVSGASSPTPPPVTRKLRINGFTNDSRGGVQYTYIDEATGESI